MRLILRQMAETSASLAIARPAGKDFFSDRTFFEMQLDRGHFSFWGLLS
jgi:hypothetical protein